MESPTAETNVLVSTVSGKTLKPTLKPKAKAAKVVLGDRVKDCPGGRHAWFESNVGVIRKPLVI